MKAKFSVVEVSEAKGLPGREFENSKLKRMIGQLSIEMMALKEINLKMW